MAADPDQVRYLTRAAAGRILCAACTATVLELLDAVEAFRAGRGDAAAAPPPDDPR